MTSTIRQQALRKYSLRAESIASLSSYRRIGKLILSNNDRALCSIYIQVKESIARDTGLGIIVVIKLIAFLSLSGVLEHPDEHPLGYTTGLQASPLSPPPPPTTTTTLLYILASYQGTKLCLRNSMPFGGGGEAT